MSTEKNERCLAIFLRGMRGEKITVTELANEYGVSAKSISRDISEIRCFLAGKPGSDRSRGACLRQKRKVLYAADR